jgi:hypothetical protein
MYEVTINLVLGYILEISTGLRLLIPYISLLVETAVGRRSEQNWFRSKTQTYQYQIMLGI